MMRVFITIEWRMISMVKTVKGDNFEDIKACGVAVADFSATWCGPCKICLLYTSPSPRDTR